MILTAEEISGLVRLCAGASGSSAAPKSDALDTPKHFLHNLPINHSQFTGGNTLSHVVSFFAGRFPSEWLMILLGTLLFINICLFAPKIFKAIFWLFGLFPGL